MSEQYHDTFPINNNWAKMPIGLIPKLIQAFSKEHRSATSALSVLIYLCEMTQRLGVHAVKEVVLSLSAKDIAKAIGIKSRDRIAKILKLLEEDGWITRTTDKITRRSSIVVNVAKILQATDLCSADVPDYDEAYQLQRWKKVISKNDCI